MYNSHVMYTWDEAKRQSNLKKPRLDFRDAELVFSGLTLTFENERFVYTERRFITLGFLDGELVVLAHSKENEENTRIISMRKATKYEESIFFKAFGN